MDSDTVVYFTGVEHAASPARGLETLFVVGARPTDEVLRIKNACEGVRHVVLGATPLGVDFEHTRITDWAQVANAADRLLREGVWVTVEYPVEDMAAAQDALGKIWLQPRLIPRARHDLGPGEANPNFAAVFDQRGAGRFASRWTVALADLERTRAWCPLSAVTPEAVVARLGDLADPAA
ncbi:MAG: hypothetical protein ACFB2Z_09615 [Maricaulaceae bacterium]